MRDDTCCFVVVAVVVVSVAVVLLLMFDDEHDDEHDDDEGCQKLSPWLCGLALVVWLGFASLHLSKVENEQLSR